MAYDNVYLFVPNLIGYVRIAFALISFYFMPTNHVIATWAYIFSSLLDAFDGYAARLLNQASKFGAFLDMLTDRCSTMCLLIVLCQLYPRWMFLFQLSIIIDIVSHWMHCQSALMKGIESHKRIDLSGNAILRYYYTDRKILFLMCAGNELFYCMLYLTYFTSGPQVLLGPLSFGLFTVICILCFPVAVIKAAISLLQLYAACENVVAIDIADRQKATAQSSAKQQ